MRPAIDMTGRVFGRLTVVGRIAGLRYDQARWACRCECGAEVILPGGWLRAGRNRSCGCYRRDRAGQLYRKHGLSKSAPYKMFYDARKRAVALGLPFTIEPSDIIVPALCPVLGIPLSMTGPRDGRPSLDRCIPALGYVPSNVCVISFRANRIKSDATAAELQAILAYVAGAK